MVTKLADRFVEKMASLDPCAATTMGVTGHDAELTDYGPDGVAARAALIRGTLSELGQAPDDGLAEPVEAAVMRERLAAELALYDAGLRLGEINVLDGPLQRLRQVFDLMDTDTEGGWENVAARLRRLPEALDLHRQGILRAAAEGRVAALRQVERSAEQCELWTGSFAELPASYGDGPLREELERGAAGVNAALEGFVRFLREELAPVAPRRDAVGRQRYALWASYFTGARLDLEETYAWGWEELRRIRAELAEVAERLAPGSLPAAVAEGLNHDPAYLVIGVEHFRGWMQELADRTIEALAGVHFDVPEPLRRLECRISPPGTGGIYYTRPSEDFSRPGRVWWSVPDGTREFSTWRAATTIFHEGAPGHHLQLGHMVYRADRLNRYQRLACRVAGHSEGWALYAERLMGELGYLEDPGERMGMLQAQAFRAARVVVDIGMHLELEIPEGTGFHEGERWTPELGNELLRECMVEDQSFLDFEIDRYLGRPGQAIAYKVGERVWLQAREARRRRDPDGFDLRGFHAMALDMGPMGLDTLRERLAAGDEGAGDGRAGG
jgi:uncharacterized protein (DUF885 family)